MTSFPSMSVPCVSIPTYIFMSNGENALVLVLDMDFNILLTSLWASRQCQMLYALLIGMFIASLGLILVILEEKMFLGNLTSLSVIYPFLDSPIGQWK
jgi:hypothetical protein